MTITEQYIRGLEAIKQNQDDVLKEFEHKIVDMFRNIVAEYSRENNLVSVDEYITAASRIIENEVNKLKGRG